MVTIVLMVSGCGIDLRILGAESEEHMQEIAASDMFKRVSRHANQLRTEVEQDGRAEAYAGRKCGCFDA